MVSLNRPETGDAVPASGWRGTWLGRKTPFTLEPVDDPLFDRRVGLAALSRGGWIVLSYRGRAVARGLRPVLRVLRRGGGCEDFVLPGAAQGRGIWLGHLPPDTQDILLAIDPRSGFILERVGRRSHASLFAECLVKRPVRVIPALFNALKRHERRFRDILRGSCAVAPIGRYRTWIAPRTGVDGDQFAPSGRSVRLILPAERGQETAVEETLGSLRAQSHRAWSVVVGWSGGANDGTKSADDRVTQRAWPDGGRLSDLAAEADIVGVLSPGERLTGDALAVLVRALDEDPVAQIAYGDAVAGDRPCLRPDWSPDLALALGGFASPTLYTGAVLARLDRRPLGPTVEFGSAAGLAAIAGATEEIVAHVPRILCRLPPASADEAGRMRLVERHLAETATPARVTQDASGFHILWDLPSPPPLVTIVIPSRDHLDLIRRSSDGVLNETAYPAIELVIVDNGSTDPAVHRHYDTLRRDSRVRIEPWPAPFNFSAMINAGVAVARGEVVVLLNNDIAILDPGWLEALVRQALRPEVGAVGAKLLYEDGTLQHAGVVVGLGGRAGHILRRRPADTPGHLGQLRVAHEVSAVTAACLAVEKAKFDSVGGLDAEAFPIDFNDVDFCLRLNAAGYKTVWTPKAVLAHLESTSRGPAVGAARIRFEAEADRFVTRWRSVIRHDPFYHPSLSLTTFGEDLE